MFLWRISNHVTLDGEGGKRASARWHSKGRQVVYLAESPAGALLETLVHIKGQTRETPDTYTLLQIEAPDEIEVDDFTTDLDLEWDDDERLTRFIGDSWLEAGRTCLAIVPCAVMPKTRNYLMNPMQVAASEIRIVDVIQARHDVRLFGFSRS